MQLLMLRSLLILEILKRNFIYIAYFRIHVSRILLKKKKNTYDERASSRAY